MSFSGIPRSLAVNGVSHIFCQPSRAYDIGQCHCCPVPREGTHCPGHALHLQLVQDLDLDHVHQLYWLVVQVTTTSFTDLLSKSRPPALLTCCPSHVHQLYWLVVQVTSTSFTDLLSKSPPPQVTGLGALAMKPRILCPWLSWLECLADAGYLAFIKRILQHKCITSVIWLLLSSLFKQ